MFGDWYRVTVHETKGKYNKEQIVQRLWQGTAKKKFSWNLQWGLRSKIVRVIEKAELRLVFVLPKH